MPQFEPGMYWMETPKLGTANSKNGTPFIFLQGQITHVAVGGETKPVPVPTERTMREFLSDKAFPYAIERLNSVGFNGDFANPALSEDHAKGVWVKCSAEEYEERQVERWQLAGGSIEHKQFNSETVRRLTAMRENHKRNAGGSIPF